MAGRGGRGGRGGGRFGGRSSVTHDLIRDNLEDLGMDAYQQEDMRIPPPMYPPIELPEPIYPKKEVALLIRKNQTLVERIRSQPYYMSRKKGPQKKSSVVEEDIDVKGVSFNSIPKDWVKYVPHELFDSSQLRKAKSKNADLAVLQNLEQQEKTGDDDNGQKKEGESDGENMDEENTEEVEMDDDYGVDHYASDGDNDDYGDDDREATY